MDSHTFRIETSDRNSNSADQNSQGAFTFEKNGASSVQNAAANGYLNVTIDYSGRQ